MIKNSKCPIFPYGVLVICDATRVSCFDKILVTESGARWCLKWANFRHSFGGDSLISEYFENKLIMFSLTYLMLKFFF